MYYKTLFESLFSPFLTFLGLIKGTFYEIEAITMLDVTATCFLKPLPVPSVVSAL